MILFTLYRILVDGSTDSAIIEKECIYVIFVDPDSFQPVLSFFGLKDPKSQDAAGLFAAVKDAFREHELDDCFEKVCFLQSDGASVNCGVKHGLIEFMREELPWVTFIWCISHRLELALKDALKDIMSDVDSVLTNLYYLYKKSSKKTRELKDLYSVFEGMYEFESGKVRPHKAHGTRWISHKLEAIRYILQFL